MRRFRLFAECVTAGLLTVLAVVPVVTLLAACAAGCAHVRAHIDGESTSLKSYVDRLRSALPGSRMYSLGFTAGFAVIGLDAVILRAGVPGAVPVVVAGVAAVAMLTVLLLRSAAMWKPTLPWGTTLRLAARRAAVEDLGGSLLLAMAAAMLALITWQLTPLVIPMAGCVLMAAVAVDRRAAALASAPEEM